MGRVVAIGLDAADRHHIRRLGSSGLLPNLSAFLDGAAILELRTDRPACATTSWTEFLTGRSAHETGYWSPLEFDPTTYEVWDIGAYRGTPFYARPDLVPVVFDVPYSTCAPDAAGIQVTSWGAHAAQFPTASRPRHVIPSIDARFGVNRALVSGGLPGWHNERYAGNLMDALLEGTAKRPGIASWVLEQEPEWELFLTALPELHVAGHQFLHGVEDHPLRQLPLSSRSRSHFDRVYAAVDRTFGALLELLDDDATIVVFTVRGMAPNGGRVPGEVLVPELLHRLTFGRPFLEFPPFEPNMPPVVLDPPSSPHEHLLRLVRQPIAEPTRSRRARLKNRVAWIARRRLPDPVLQRVRGAYRRVAGTRYRQMWWEMKVRPPWPPSKDVTRTLTQRRVGGHVAAWYAAHWPRMRYFVVPSLSDCHIRVNLRTRERDGVVDIASYVRVLEEIERTLRAITDARSGRPIVADVFRVRADDPLAPDGPPADLVATFDGVTDAIAHPDVGVVGPAPLLLAGEHTEEGWAAFRLPGAGGRHVGEARPQDLTATMVDLLGLPRSPLVTGQSFASRLHEAATPPVHR